MSSLQKNIMWVLSLALTVIICGYGICLLERGVHRLMAKHEMNVDVKEVMMDHHGDMGKPDSAGPHDMMPKDCCKDSAHAGHAGMMPGACGPGGMHPGCDEHRGMGACGMHDRCGDHRGMGCCDGHMGMRRPMGPPPAVGYAFTAGLGAFVLLIGAVFGMMTLRPRGEKS